MQNRWSFRALLGSLSVAISQTTGQRKRGAADRFTQTTVYHRVLVHCGRNRSDNRLVIATFRCTHVIDRLLFPESVNSFSDKG